MANEEQLAILKRGSEFWNAWRQEHVGSRPSFRRADFSGADLGGANLDGADLRAANLAGTDLRRADLRDADLERADLRHADLGGANLAGADLRHANLRDANLAGADLHDAELGRADLRRADLRGANLAGADLRHANLGGANLRDANLAGANLCDAYLRDANLGGADLRGANLSETDFCRADLRGADLRGVDLRGVALDSADLRGANLNGARLWESDLGEAGFGGANLDGAWLERQPTDAPAPAGSADPASERRQPGTLAARTIAGLVAIAVDGAAAAAKVAAKALAVLREAASQNSNARTTATLPGTADAPLRAMADIVAPDAQPVDAAVFCPPRVTKGSTFLVQVFLYPPGVEREAAAQARETDPGAAHRGRYSLPLDLPPGTRVDVHLEMPGLVVPEPDAVLIWRGRPTANQFEVVVPAGMIAAEAIGRVRFAVAGVPVGTFRFKIEFGEEGSMRAATALREAEAVRYRRAFVSYSSEDRVEVLRRVQAFRIAGLSVFQDLLDLEPGELWERALYREIDACDVFLLFWSRAAAASEWVAREISYVLTLKAGSEDRPPAIQPVPIEGPPVPPPPEALRHLHFNDALLTQIQAAARQAVKG
jgi:uncharacterized protein YjbI with pentapeptide repeats